MPQATLRLALSTLIGLLATAIVAQGPPPPPTDQIAAIAELDRLVGEWKGSGWHQRGPDTRTTFDIHETVEPKLGGVVLLVQGLGTTPAADGAEPTVVHEALAVLSWDPATETYRFETHTGAGQHAETTFDRLDETTWRWGLEIPQGEFRYTIDLSEEGRWHETGEFSPDGGETWYHFHEMTLSRTSS